MRAILVTGGAGYIGSEVVHQLLSLGQKVVVIDNLSTGDVRRLPSKVDFIQCDIRNEIIVEELFRQFNFSTVFHFAAFKQARESNENPNKYWTNNVAEFIAFLNVAAGFNLENLILSSSCSVYGNAGFVDESTDLKPISVYGWTKLVSEQLVDSYSKLHNWKHASLRYFNVIGSSDREYAADYDSQCILPALFRCVSRSETFIQFGDDFDTPDRTAIRDYIDVKDVASAHLHALKMLDEGFIGSLNVSSGAPKSVFEILEIVRSVIPNDFRVSIAPRSSSDPSQVWANPSRELVKNGWRPNISFDQSMIDHWNSFLKYSKSAGGR